MILDKQMRLAIKYRQHYWAANIMMSWFSQCVEGLDDRAGRKFDEMLPYMPKEVLLAMKELNKDVFASLDKALDMILMHK